MYLYLLASKLIAYGIINAPRNKNRSGGVLCTRLMNERVCVANS